jgi:1-acyl-sn-glycerol-3-phosphate acyltransferase
MNPFTSIPKLLQFYFGVKGFCKNIPEIERLRTAGDIEAEKEVVRLGQKKFIEETAPKLKLTFEVIGEENIPDKDMAYMVYANHQSYADILAMIWLFRNHRQMGYVAKEEWRKVKILYNAIYYTRSIFLKRGDSREAVKSIKEVCELLKQGFALVIFPEGTRSQRHEMGEFKAGAFKFAEKGKVPILPVTLDGGYKLYEEKKTYQPAHVKITVHPLVHIEEMSKAEQKEAAKQIEETIRSALD